MTELLLDDAVASAALHIVEARPTARKPYWHRDEPLVAVSNLDPDHAQLRLRLPQLWQSLVRVKTLIDGIVALEAPEVTSPVQHLGRIAPLLTAATYELSQCVDVALAAGVSGGLIGEMRQAADRLLTYAHTGEWKLVRLSSPRPGEPWLYCGPLNTWAMHSARSAIGFLLVFPRADLQEEVDAVDARRDVVRATAAAMLGGGPIRSALDCVPTMVIADLLLAGGESVIGHKNFAHFFPLEAAATTVPDAEFTVVFANVHSERLRRCSAELLRQYAGTDAALFDHDELLRSSIRWFRCHDLGHFWRRPELDKPAGPGLSPFEQMTLEEAYADVMGLACAAAAGPAGPLAQSFTAELLRYLSRRQNHFADSAAAMLTAGWLRQRGILIGRPDDWLPAALPVLAELTLQLYRVLWEGDETGVADLRSALEAGRPVRDDLAGVFRAVPTDLDYTFG